MTASPEVFTAHHVGDLAGAMPTMFGFTPEHSIVAISTNGARNRFGFRLRVDLPTPADIEKLADLIVMHLRNNGADGMVLAAIGSSTEQALGVTTMEAIACKDVPLVVAMWIDQDAGTVVDINDPNLQHYDVPAYSPAVAGAVRAGMQIMDTRAQVEASFGSVKGDLSIAVGTALMGLGGDAEVGVDDTLDAMHRTLGAAPGDTTVLLPSAIATLGVGVLSIEQRDTIWGEITRTNAGEYAAALHTAAVNLPERLAFPVYALTGFAYWLSGDGVRALVAAERSLKIKPGYSMAELVRVSLEIGMAPTKWVGIPV